MNSLSLETAPSYTDQLNRIVSRMNGARRLDELFADIQEPIRSLIECDRVTLYMVDRCGKIMTSKFKTGDVPKQIRLPVDKNSVAGYVAATGGVITIMDAYDNVERMAIYPDLKFDSSWDRLSGYHTRQILAGPVRQNGRLIGVIQFINKKTANSFTAQDRKAMEDIGAALGSAIQTVIRKQNRCKTRYDYLVAHNIIAKNALDLAEAHARKRDRGVEDVLLKEYGVSKPDLGRSLAAYYGVSFFSCDESFAPPPTLLNRLSMKQPFRFMEHNGWAPFRLKDGALYILCDDPSDRQKASDIQRVVKNGSFKLFVGLTEDIRRIISLLSGRSKPALREMEDTFYEPPPEETTDKEETGEAGVMIEDVDQSVIDLVNDIILEAHGSGVSDIHIETYPGRKNTIVRYRQDGVCFESRKLPAGLKRAVVARIKVMANLNIAERRLPQDGKIQLRLGDKTLELRVATVPTNGGNEDAVLRILGATEPLPLDKLNFHPRNYQVFKEAIAKPYGIFLVVGPTGSGKTTTLHSALGHINTPERKIWTAEDPVEITQHGLRQVQMRPDINLTFATAMRAFLRADPDVIMVGEIRDSETATMGIEASLTGHLVFSTLHTNSAPETVVRLIDLGIDPFNFADALIGVLAQRLVRTLCPHCKVEHTPSTEELRMLAKEYGEDQWPEMEEAVAAGGMRRASGCKKCNHTGFKGRTGLHEVLIMNHETKRLIQTRSAVDDIRASAVKNGMRTLKQDGIWKTLRGDTTIKHVRAVCSK